MTKVTEYYFQIWKHTLMKKRKNNPYIGVNRTLSLPKNILRSLPLNSLISAIEMNTNFEKNIIEI